jgi:hypothetical protein
LKLGVGALTRLGGQRIFEALGLHGQIECR